MKISILLIGGVLSDPAYQKPAGLSPGLCRLSVDAAVGGWGRRWGGVGGRHSGSEHSLFSITL